MEFFSNNIIITILMPLWAIGFVLSSIIFKFSENKRLTVLITVLSTIICTVFTLCAQTLPIEKNIHWLDAGNLSLYLGTLLDKTSKIFLLILMIISLLVQIYSYGYMKTKEEFSRYYIYLNFFNFSMAGLLLSTNLIQMYIFWELVGVASYLLIGFFHKKDDVSKSAKKVFFVNRIGDFALLCGIIILTYFSITYENSFGTSLLNFSNIDELKLHLISLTSEQTYNLVILLLIIGGFVKSAQFPFHTWLIDAMKAPTPVSALIHSATMVCMGIFLITRIFPLLTPELLTIIAFLGLLTAFVCAFIAIAQTNIKKILAYSTSSQLGLMFLALGLGSINIAIIYLVIHSFTKALLFLCSGAISNNFDTLEINQMGGLRKNNFYLAIYWLTGALSISGLFFGGFISKEILVNYIHDNANIAILFTTLFTSFLTTFYIFRSYFMIFEGDKKEIIDKEEKTMNFSMMIMAVFAICPILMIFNNKLNQLAAVAVLINLFAVMSAFFSYKCNKIPLPSFLISCTQKELYIPTLYNKLGNLFLSICNLTYIFDKYVIDNLVNFTGKFTKIISNIISKIQNGNIQSYISYSIFAIGTFLAILIYFYLMEARG